MRRFILIISNILCGASLFMLLVSFIIYFLNKDNVHMEPASKGLAPWYLGFYGIATGVFWFIWVYDSDHFQL